MSIIGSSSRSPRTAAVVLRPKSPLTRSSSCAFRAASMIMVGMGFGVAVKRDQRSGGFVLE